MAVDSFSISPSPSQWCEELWNLLVASADNKLTMKVFNRARSPRSSSATPKGSASPVGGRKHSNGKSWKKVVDTDEENSEHNLSDLSNSSDAEDIDNLESLDDNSEDCEHFERQLRYKHSKACKAMSVRRSK